MQNPDVLEKRTGGGCLILFGLPFLLTGLFVLTSPLKLFPVEWEGGSPPPWGFAIPFGGIFALVGAALMFGRAGVKIDRFNKRIVRWWSLIVPLRRKEYDLSEYDRVTVKREVRRSKNSSYTVYPVRLAGGKEAIDYETPRDALEARKAAEELAKFLDLKIEDSSRGETVVRDAHELDQSLRERVKQTGAAVETPDMPANMRTQCRIEGQQIMLNIPPAASGPLAKWLPVLALAPPILVSVIAFSIVFADNDIPREMKYVFSAFMFVFLFALPAVIFGYKALSKTKHRQIVTASPDMLRVEDRGVFRTKVTEIPAAELEELILPKKMATPGSQEDFDKLPPIAKTLISAIFKTPGITAVSDNASVVIGQGLMPDELQWIHAVLTKLLTS